MKQNQPSIAEQYQASVPLSEKDQARHREIFYKIHKGKDLDTLTDICIGDGSISEERIESTSEYLYGRNIGEMIDFYEARYKQENQGENK